MRKKQHFLSALFAWMAMLILILYGKTAIMSAQDGVVSLFYTVGNNQQLFNWTMCTAAEANLQILQNTVRQ